MTATYTAHCEWDGHSWVASVEEVPGAFTQAKRLELLPPRVAEVIKLMTGNAVAESDITLVRELTGEVGEQAEEVARLRADLDDIQRTLNDRQPKVIRSLRRHGLTIRDIGALVGLSPQRVQQILKASDEPG